MECTVRRIPPSGPRARPTRRQSLRPVVLPGSPSPCASSTGPDPLRAGPAPPYWTPEVPSMTELAQHGTIAIPEATSTQAATSIEDCDAAVADLAKHTGEWLEASPAELVELLRRLNDSVIAAGPQWVEAAVAAKQIPAGSPLVGEEWTGVAVTARYITALIGSLTDIAAGRRPRTPGRAHPVAGDRTAVPVFPGSAVDKVALSGFTAEVWLRPGITANQAVGRQAAA